MSFQSLLSIIVKAKDEASGPMAQVSKAYDDMMKLAETADKKIVQSEKEKREAMKQAREAMKLAQTQAANLKLALSGVGGAMEALAKSSGLTASQLVIVQTGLRLAETAASAVYGAVRDVAGAFADAVKKGSEFNYRMAEVSTLVDTAKVPVGELGEYVRDLAGQFGQSPITEAKALYQAISAGAFKASEASAIMTTANRLAVAGVTDVFVAVDGLTNAINAFGGSMTEGESVANAFFVAMRDGKTTIPEFSSAIGNVASSARNVGVTLDETAASIAAITTKGIKTDEAVTALNQAFTALIKPAKNAGEEARRLGIDFSTAGMQAAGGFIPFLQKIALNEKLTSQSIGKLFGNVRGIKAVFALMGDEGKKVNEILADMRTKSGSVASGLDKISETTWFQVKRFDALRETIAATFGSMIDKSPAVQGAVAGINDALDGTLRALIKTDISFGTTKDSMQKMVREGIAGALDGFADFLDILPKISKALGWVWTLLDGITGPLKKMGAGLSKAGEAVGDLYDAAAEKFGFVKATTDEAGDSIANFARRAAAAIREGRAAAADITETETAAINARGETLKKIMAQAAALADAEEGGSKKAQKAEDARYKAWVQQTREKLREANREDAEAERRANKAIADAERQIEREARAKERAAKKAAKELEKAQEQQNEQIGRASEFLGGSLAHAFDQALFHAQNFGDMVTAILEDLTIKAASGALAQIFSKGLTALATAGAGGPLGAILSFFGFARGGVVGETKPQHFASGGIARGPSGTDQIPALISGSRGLAPARISAGEGILPPELTSALRRVLGVPQVSMAGASSGGGGVTFVLPPIADRGPPPDSAQITRWQRDSMLPALRQLHASGQLDFLGRR